MKFSYNSSVMVPEIFRNVNKDANLHHEIGQRLIPPVHSTRNTSFLPLHLTCNSTSCHYKRDGFLKEAFKKTTTGCQQFLKQFLKTCNVNKNYSTRITAALKKMMHGAQERMPTYSESRTL